MYKHTIKDFLGGSICVRCNTLEDKQRMLQLCAETGITKTLSSTFSIQQTVAFFNVFYIDRDALTLSTLSETTAKFCDVVPFSSLSSDTHRRRIVIDYSDTITIATLYNGEKDVKSTTISRCHNDNPSVHIAAIEAINKLLAKQAKQPKKTAKPENLAEKEGFKIGDRVVVSSARHDLAYSAHGKHGTIVSLENEAHGENLFAVKLDEPVYDHDCLGQTKPGHGCYANAETLRHEQPANPQVREVKRRANVGEWVKITQSDGFEGERYRNGDILQVVKTKPELDVLSCGGVAVRCSEYVVLENYHPEEHANA